MRRIPLRDRAGVVVAYSLVDDDIFAQVGHLSWSLSREGYVQNRALNVRLHRVVMGLGARDADQVDHRNRDPLDNRRVNLRRVPPLAQAQNRSAQGGSRSRYRGVSARGSRWAAQVRSGGRLYHLGIFDTEELAAAAASGARRVLMPFSIEKQEATARTVTSREAAAS